MNISNESDYAGCLFYRLIKVSVETGVTIKDDKSGYVLFDFALIPFLPDDEKNRLYEALVDFQNQIYELKISKPSDYEDVK